MSSSPWLLQWPQLLFSRATLLFGVGTAFGASSLTGSAFVGAIAAMVLLDRGSVAKAGPTADVLTREVLEPVYRVSVRVLDDEDCTQSVFRPQVPVNEPQPSTG